MSGWIESVTLPVLALLVGSVASAAWQFRGAVLDTLSKDFVRTLRARGNREISLVFRHVLRNSAGAGLTMLSLQTWAARRRGLHRAGVRATWDGPASRRRPGTG